MAQESPVYRPVACAAALCRVKLSLLDGDHAGAIAELRALRRWASRHGAGRLLIDVNILLAYGLRCSSETAASQACFDEAVGIAMFQGLLRPFIDARGFVEPFLSGGGEAAASGDRFRGRFLKALSKALATRSAPGEPDGLNEAEATILRHLGQGISNKEIARLIGMSPDTVKYRLKSIFRKIDVTTRRDAVRVSRERGLLIPVEGPSTF
jgi:LuxR family maltose regulon positive regulatory protein